MQTKSIGVGSASLILIFTVLCLAVFALISHTTANGDMARARAGAKIVEEYYDAVVLAETIVADMLRYRSGAEAVPEMMHGVPIIREHNGDADALVLSFSCPMSDRKELYVRILLKTAGYDILAWRMRDIGEWEPDLDLPVWPFI